VRDFKCLSVINEETVQIDDSDSSLYPEFSEPIPVAPGKLPPLEIIEEVIESAHSDLPEVVLAKPH